MFIVKIQNSTQRVEQVSLNLNLNISKGLHVILQMYKKQFKNCLKSYLQNYLHQKSIGVQSWTPLKVGRGDNLQLFISPLLKYEGLYNIIDDKKFEINSLEPPCTGDLKIPHTPMGTCRNAKKKKKIEFCFDCGKNVFQWTKKNHLGHFDWNFLGYRYPIRLNT